MPKVSTTVIIPAYNVETCLERAILSALNQTLKPNEVIVINDGSSDGTAIVALKLGDRIRYIEQLNQGPANARNVGMDAAMGEYVAFLDADDYWHPGFLKATVEFLETHSEAIAVSTGWQIQPIRGEVKTFPPHAKDDDIPRQPCILDNFFDFWGRYDHVRTGTVLLRRSKLGANGFQQTDLRICEDLEFWGHIATIGPWGFIPDAYWFGDSARVAAAQGDWLNRYKKRRTLTPTVEEWQARILPKLEFKYLSGFKKMRGRIGLISAHNMLLSGQFKRARKTISAYKGDLPEAWTSWILKTGHCLGVFFWNISCFILLIREYQKAFTMSQRNRSFLNKIVTGSFKNL